MGKTNRNNGESKKIHGVVHPVNMGSVGDAISSSDAGRERKRHERELAERNRTTRRQEEDQKRKGDQVTDTQELAIKCDLLLKGTIGQYNVFGLEAEVRMHNPNRGGDPFSVFEFIDAMWEKPV